MISWWAGEGSKNSYEVGRGLSLIHRDQKQQTEAIRLIFAQRVEYMSDINS
jgi:hypothetical protein